MKILEYSQFKTLFLAVKHTLAKPALNACFPHTLRLSAAALQALPEGLHRGDQKYGECCCREPPRDRQARKPACELHPPPLPDCPSAGQEPQE